MTKKFKLILFFMNLFCCLHAQESGVDKITLSGYISDASNGEDLIGATILIQGTGNGTVTNAYGYYSLNVPLGNYKAIISYLGYGTQTIEINLQKDETLNIELSSESEMLQEIVVSSEAENENVETIEMSVNKLDVKVLKQLPVVFGETDILKSIQLLPGVSSVHEGASGFNVRGGAADQNLVLLDEAPVYNTSHLFGFFSVFNPDAIKDVKLYKGGIPSEYGGRIASVLDVRQKEGNSKKLGLSGGIGTISSRLTVEAPIAKDKNGNAKGSFMLAGRRSYADVFLKLGLVSELKDVTLYFYDLNMKANYRIGEKDRIFISGYLGRDVMKLPDLFGNNWGNSTFTMRWNHLFSDKLFSNFTGIYSNYDYSLENFATGTSFEWKSNIINWNGKADFSYFRNNNNTIKFGAGAIYYKFQPGQISPTMGADLTPTTLQPKFAIEPTVYISNEHKISDKLTLLYGLRYASFYRLGNETIREYEDNAPVSYNEQTGIYNNGIVTSETNYESGKVIKSFHGLEPRFSANYIINPQHSIKASYNRLNQYIHLISNTTSATPLDIWTPSGSYIKPQIGDQVALGYFSNFKDNTYEFSAEIYYKWLQNQIDYVDGAELTFNNYIETELLSGKGRAYGLELLLKKNKGKFTGWFSYAYTQTERKIEGINNGKFYPANFEKPHEFSLTAIYNFTDRLSVSGNFAYSTGRPITYPNGKYTYNELIVPLYQSRNEHRLPDYHRLDFAVTLKGKPNKRWRGDWTFGIYNVYNRLNASSIYFQEKIKVVNDVDVRTGQTEAVKLSYFGIIPSVTYEFKF